MLAGRAIDKMASRDGDHLDGSRCQVFAESMQVQLADGVLYPDLMVACSEHDAGDELTVTDPTLIIEVLSPSTRGYDRRDKFILYRTLASLQEYVLVDPSTRQIEVFTRADEGAWLLTDQTNREALVLDSIDLRVGMALVFKGVAA